MRATDEVPGDAGLRLSWGAGAHHDGSRLFVSTAYPVLDERVTLRLRVEDRLAVGSVHLRTTVDGTQRFLPCTQESGRAGESWWQVEVSMRNRRLGYRFLLGTASGARWLDAAGLHNCEVPDTHDFALTIDARPPAWAAPSVFYQVFLDRFARSGRVDELENPGWAVPAGWNDEVVHGDPSAVHQLYRGDLWGVLEHLDHLSELGISALYLTPFFPAASNHRYDATSFDHVDPLLGGDEALAALIKGAHERGIRVVGDLTLNHTGDQHEWFRRACADPASEEAGFYFFHRHPDSYEAFDDVPSLPKLDHRSALLRSRLFDGPDSIAARYVRDFGLDGWRIDVAQSAGHCGASDRTLESARELRATVAEHDALIIAEHQFDASAALAGDAWHGTMAYAAFTRPLWSWLAPAGIDRYWGQPVEHARYSGTAMAATMDAFTALIPWRSRVHSLNLLDSHDTPRLLSVVGKQLFLVAVGMMLTMPGLPMIFAGDEIGTEGSGLEDSRRPFRWDQNTWDREIRDLYGDLLAIRARHPALSSGGFRWLHTDNDVVVYERAHPEERLIIQASRAPHPSVACPLTGIAVHAETDLSADGSFPTSGPAFRIWQASAPPRQPTRHFGTTATGPFSDQ